MHPTPQRLWVSNSRLRPGTVSLISGLILASMGFLSVYSDRKLIEGPPDEQLVPVRATLTSAQCRVKRVSSPGAAHASEYGVPEFSYRYEHGGQAYESQRYHRQRNTPVGSLKDCEQLASTLQQQPGVQAWVDPANPGFAILDKSLRDESFAGIFASVGGALALLGTWRLLRKRAACV